MNVRFGKLMELHEKEDGEYVKSREAVIGKIKEEFENAEEFLKAADSAAKSFFDYSVTEPKIYAVLPVRKSDKLYIKKHTSSQRPYFHTHSFYELIYVVKGKCVQFVYPCGKKTVLKEKGVCLLSPGAAHAIAKCGEKDIILKLVIPCELFPKALKIADVEILTFKDDSEKAGFYLQNLIQETTVKRDYDNPAAENWLSLLLIELFRESKRENAIGEKLLTYIERNFPPSLKGFASFVGYSQGYAARLLKRETGKNFTENIMSLRLKKAEELLRNTDLSVENVSLEVGFANSSGLYKTFYQNYGMTPSEFRKSVR